MQKIVLFFLLISTYFIGNAQIYDPVTYQGSIKQLDSITYQLNIETSIDPGWHLYSQTVPEGGPIATTISFTDNANYQLKGKTIEPKGHEIDDPVFGMRIKYFENHAVFSQTIIRQTNAAFSIQAQIEYMVCNDESCLPPTQKKVNFKFEALKQIASTKSIEKKNADVEKKHEEEAKQEVDTINSDKATSLNNNISPDNPTAVENTAHKTDTEDSSLWNIFLISFLGGFAALLTPCVFPMIPMTVSFFTKQSQSRAAGISNAIFYGISIIAIYVFLGYVVTKIFGADALNSLSTNIWFNLIFFVILVAFALSFLGAFEIVLPSSWATKVDSKADRGGFIGIFFMALALAIVSFSCTGPIVGTLLVQSASQGGVAPVVGMLGFSTAIALPFTLFAAFPGWLNSLPKSGGWLNTVKVVLGFLELALAFKFLSNADLVLQLHLLERETFLAIWIAVFGGLALYLFGKLRLPHDSPLEYISVGRLSLGILVLAFTIYMIPGLWGAPLQWISGFPPPMQYSESPYGVGNSEGGGLAATPQTLEEGMELGPLDLPVFKDYEAGMAYAEKQGKPVLLDFTGYACVNCRKMEERVWPDPKVESILRDEVVLISLYVDDKKELPEDEQYVSETTGQEVETIGNKWSDFQITHFKANAQPYYVLLDNKGNMLQEPTAYDPNIESYTEWLQNGIKAYKKKNKKNDYSFLNEN